MLQRRIQVPDIRTVSFHSWPLFKDSCLKVIFKKRNKKIPKLVAESSFHWSESWKRGDTKSWGRPTAYLLKIVPIHCRMQRNSAADDVKCEAIGCVCGNWVLIREGSRLSGNNRVVGVNRLPRRLLASSSDRCNKRSNKKILKTFINTFVTKIFSKRL